MRKKQRVIKLVNDLLNHQKRELGKQFYKNRYQVSICKKFYKYFKDNVYWENLPIFIDLDTNLVEIKPYKVLLDDDGDEDWMMTNPVWRNQLLEDISWFAYQWDKIKCKYYDFNLKLKTLAVKFKKLCCRKQQR